MRAQVFTITGLSVAAGMVFLAVSGVRTFDTHEAPLYERLGGEVGVEGVLNRFVANVADDDRLSVRFANIDMDRLQVFLGDWVCEAGGPCDTNGKDPVARRRGCRLHGGRVRPADVPFFRRRD